MVGWERWLYNWTAGPANIVKGITENVTVSEQRDRVKTTARLVATQTILVSEAFVEPPRVKRGARLLTETLDEPTGLDIGSYSNISYAFSSFTSVSETLARVRTAVRAFVETADSNETISRRKNGIVSVGVAPPEPPIIISSLVQKIASKIRLLYDSGTPPASFEDLSFTNTSFWTTSRQISDTVTVQKLGTLSKTITETVTIGEQVAQLTTKIRTVIETELVSDTLDNLNAKIRENIEIIVEPEELLTSEVTSSALLHTKTLDESETIGEDILSQAEKARTINETEVITDRLQGWAKGVPMQVEPVPTPDITNIIGAREFYVRPQEPRPPRFEYAIENTVYAPLRILALVDANKAIATIRTVTPATANPIQISMLRVRDKDKALIRSPIATLLQPNLLQSSLRIPQHPHPLTASLKLYNSPVQKALEPRKIINIEKKYRTLKTYLLLHMIESLD